jgi:hypothetical protein
VLEDLPGQLNQSILDEAQVMGATPSPGVSCRVHGTPGLSHLVICCETFKKGADEKQKAATLHPYAEFCLLACPIGAGSPANATPLQRATAYGQRTARVCCG